MRHTRQDDGEFTDSVFQITKSIPATRIRPGCSISLALSIEEGAGKPGADCARSPVCNGVDENAHGLNHRYSQDIPAFPAQWFYGFLRALPGERPLLSPLPAPHRQGRIDARVAAPGPHDFAVRGALSSGAHMRLRLPRPSQPAPRSVTIAQNVPHGGAGWADQCQ